MSTLSPLPPPSLSMDRCIDILTHPHLPLAVIRAAWEDAKLRRGQRVDWARIGPPAHRREPATPAMAAEAGGTAAPPPPPGGNAVLAALRAAAPAIAAAVAARRGGQAHGHDHGGDAA